MIIVTGGAGFIGSVLHAALAKRGMETVVVDRLGCEGKWRNLAKHPPARLIAPEQLEDFLATNPRIEAIVHLGAISETTATDGDLTWATNVELPLRLWRWCAERSVRLIYASSAATYGDGSAGFEDGLDGLDRFQPLNLYGWTKRAFDLRVARMLERGEPSPPQWVGLKFFNVFGPNEYHKGEMISLVGKRFDEAKAGKTVRLFKSHRDGIGDGEQKRDFIYVDDAVAVVRWLLDTPSVSGIFNVGTGKARSFRDLISAMFRALGRAPDIEYVDMPPAIRDQYQYFTQAKVENLRKAGYNADFTPLEEGVTRYVTFLNQPDRYR
jgi:ADP-L-glycero-D-manno-heptose 6-epimerase